MPSFDLDVLVVDDDPSTREAIAALLTAWGASVRTAASAHEAREAFAHVRPDVLISDLGMPGEDGCALVSDLRRRDAARGDDRLHTIACTGHLAAADTERALACGFDSVLHKPLDVQALWDAVAQGAGIAGRWPVETEVSPARDS